MSGCGEVNGHVSTGYGRRDSSVEFYAIWTGNRQSVGPVRFPNLHDLVECSDGAPGHAIKRDGAVWGGRILDEHQHRFSLELSNLDHLIFARRNGERLFMRQKYLALYIFHFVDDGFRFDLRRDPSLYQRVARSGLIKAGG